MIQKRRVAAYPKDGTRRLDQGVLSFLVLGILIPAAVADMRWKSGGFNGALAVGITVFLAARISALIAAGQPRMLQLGFYLFAYPFLGLASLAQISAFEFPLKGQIYSVEQLSSALVTVAVGIAAFEVGCLLSPGRSHLAGVIHAEVRPAAVLSLTGLGLVMLAYAFATTGLQPFFSSREEVAQTLAGTTSSQIYALDDKTGYLLRSNLTRVPIFVALIALCAAMRAGTWRYGRLGRPGTAMLALVLVLANVVANNFIGNSRFWFGVVFLGLIGCFVDWRTEKGFRVLAVAGLGTFVFLFGFLDIFRRAEGGAVSFNSPRETYLANGTYSGFQTIATGQQYLDAFSNTFGQQLATAVLTPIPRRFWEGKGVDTGAVIDPRYNRAATLWTELQIDFGLVGTIIGFLLLGAVAVRMQDLLVTASLPAAVILPIAAGVMILLLRGSLVTAMGSIYPLAFFYLLTVSVKRCAPPPASHCGNSESK